MIATSYDLDQFCTRIQDARSLAIDTEFIREESYLPRLETIQVFADGVIDIIDYPSVKDMAPFWNLMYSNNVVKILHAGQQDLGLFFQATGRPLTNIFDTQIAASVVGYGEQIGYGQLVKHITGVVLSKSQSYTSWGLRPLTPAQIEYALDDVRYLPEIHSHLVERLQERGRLEWARQEFALLEQTVLTEPVPLTELYIKVRGAENLEGRDLAILRELTVWREQEAQYRNRLPQRLLRDELLVSIARRPPENIGELKRMRGFPVPLADNLGQGIINAARKGAAVLPEQWPEKPKSRYADPPTQAIVALLQALVRGRAVEKQIAASLLATTAEMEEIAQRRDEMAEGMSPALTGWRYDFIGRDIIRLLNGELRLRFDPTTAQVATDQP